jgi:hypothetical protein
MAQRARATRRLVLCCAAMLVAGCTRIVDGAAVPGSGDSPRTGVNVDEVLLDQPGMRAITGAGEDLTIIPSMDGTSPVDIDSLADELPPQCRFVFAETATFGSDIEQFHKITFQDPPKSALISEGAGGYRDAGTAQQAFDALVATVDGCAASSKGSLLIGEWSADGQALHTRPGDCGRDYRVKATVLLEVTFCGFPESVSDIVLTNMAANVPG